VFNYTSITMQFLFISGLVLGRFFFISGLVLGRSSICFALSLSILSLIVAYHNIDESH
jgi:hypothetical protein